MPLLPALGGGLAIGQGLFQGLLGLTQLFRGNRMQPKRPTYEISPEAQAGLAQRQTQLNARAAGAAQAEQNIYQNQAAAVNNASQGATDAQTLLAAAAGAQGTTNRALNQLQVAENQDYQQRLAGLEAQQANMTQQRDKAFQINEMQPFIDATNTKAGLTEGGLQNIYGAMGDMSAVLGKAYAAQNNKGMSPMGIGLSNLPTMPNMSQVSNAAGLVPGIGGYNASQMIGGFIPSNQQGSIYGVGAALLNPYIK